MKKSHTVKSGHLSTRVWQVTLHGRERWRYQLAGMKSPRTVASLTDAKDQARAGLRKLQGGDSAVDNLSPAMRRELAALLEVAGTPEELRAATAWLSQRQASETVEEAVRAFIEEKEGEVSKRYLGGMRRELERLSASVSGAIAGVTTRELSDWLDQRCDGLAPKTRRDVRGYLITLWRWARSKGMIAASEITEADRLPVVRVRATEIRVLSIAECEIILREVSRDWLPYVCVALFLGVRPEEAAAMADRGKATIGWEMFDWEFGSLRIPAEVAKGGARPRIVPLNACAVRWLEPLAKKSGRLARGSFADSGETRRLGKLLDGGRWPHDALRHTYATARNSLLRDLPQLSEELGNSVAMLHRHYHHPEPAEFGEAFFALDPARIRKGWIGQDKKSAAG